MGELADRLEHEIPKLRRYARSLCRAHSTYADDLVQDTLVRAVAKQHLWQEGTNLGAWLFTLMHNLYVNNVRTGSREGTHVDIETATEAVIAVCDPSAPVLLRDLDRALAKLPLEQREVILLVGLEELSYEEAARVLHVPIGTIRSRLSRGRELLRQLMGVYPDTPLPEKQHSDLAA
jgi:RNA polymerase sigma-70 factor (ECF subfamily)